MYLSSNPALPPDPDVRCTRFDRTADRYLEAVMQFEVATHPRYAIRDTSGDGVDDTFCNVFVADCAVALGVFLPYWWLGRELNANALVDWLRERGPKYGWEELTSAHAAVACVLASFPTIAAWKNPSGRSGHVAILLPVPQTNEQDPLIAQAGRVSFVGRPLSVGFGELRPTFFTTTR